MKRSLTLALLCTLLCTPGAWASPSQEQVVKAVLGEARGSSLGEMQAIAGAIINRGTLKGVYGYKVAEDKSDAKTRLRALKALKQAIVRDPTNGATHWLSAWDLKHCRPSLIAWRKNMDITLTTEHFTFYKERG